MHPSRHRLGLRFKLTISFAVGSLFLSLLVVLPVYFVIRADQVENMESAAIETARANRRTVESRLDAGEKGDQVLATTPQPQGAQPIVRYDSEWLNLQPFEFEWRDIPAQLRTDVVAGTPSKTIADINGEIRLIVGMPFEGRATDIYYEVTPLGEEDRLLRNLGLALAGTAFLATFAGAAVGYWMAKRLLEPLREVSWAAEAIAQDQLDTRLPPADGDPDLEGLVRSFNHMAEALQGRIERDGRFASDVSHELRSPLTTIRQSIELLKSRRDDLPDDASRTLVDWLADDVNRFETLVTDLLEISRFDAGVARLEPSLIIVPEFLEAVVAENCNEPIPVSYETDLENLVIEADKRRLMQILANLLTNADKYGGGATRVELAKTADGIQIAVQDSGPGVPAADREIIFDRFSRGKTSGMRGKDKGVGLGLSLVSEHAALHGGSVWVEDRPDGECGARFVVSMPAEALALEEVAG